MKTTVKLILPPDLKQKNLPAQGICGEVLRCLSCRQDKKRGGGLALWIILFPQFLLLSVVVGQRLIKGTHGKLSTMEMIGWEFFQII